MAIGCIVDVGAGLPSTSPNISQTSRVWYADGFWWCIAQNGSGDDWFIYKKTDPSSTPGTEAGWTETAHNIDTRASAVIDAFFEEGAGATSDGLLHVVAMHSSVPYYSQWDYNAAADTYAINTSVGSSGLLDISDGSELGSAVDGNVTLCVCADSTGEVFIAYIDQSADELIVGYNADPENDNFATYTIDASIETASGAQKCSMVPFDDGNASIGILYMDADEDVGFAYHLDANASNSWSTEVAYAEVTADDHLHLTADDSGNLFGVTKNGEATSKLQFHKKASGGSWATTNIFDDGNQTRPQCVVDVTNNEVYVFYTNETTDDIDYVKSAIGTISFGSAVVSMDADEVLNDVSLPKHTITSTTGLISTCWNASTEEVWWIETATAYTTDFDEYITGEPLSDWTDFWANGSFTFTAELASGKVTRPLSTKCLDFDPDATVEIRALTWDDVGDVADVDILIKFDPPGASGPSNRFWARVGGADGSEDGYCVELTNTVTQIDRYVGGSKTVLATTEEVVKTYLPTWMRFRVNGTDLKCKVWEDTCPEPEDWTLETTDSEHNSGYVGLAGVGGNDNILYIDYFQCVTGGGSPTYPEEVYTNAEITCWGSVSPVLQYDAAFSGARLLGGMFREAGKKITHIGIRAGSSHGDQVRLALYKGGNLTTGPNGATLVSEIITTGADVNQYIYFELPAEDQAEIDVDTIYWIGAKTDGVSGTFNISYDDNSSKSMNFQKARGRYVCSTGVDADPDVAWPDTLSVTGSFANTWYGLQMYLAEAAINTTTVGVATAEAASSSSIDVAMPYTDDGNGDNTYTVDYKLSSAESWTNWVTGATHTASPYETTITGLTPGETYDVRCTYVDDDGVTGTNPQTIEDIELEAEAGVEDPIIFIIV